MIQIMYKLVCSVTSSSGCVLYLVLCVVSNERSNDSALQIEIKE